MKTKFNALLLSLAVALCVALPATAFAADLPHVTDTAYLMSDSEIADLEAQAQAIEDEYGFGAYIVTLDDYRAISEESAFDAAMAIYECYDLGVGEDRDGLLLLLSMAERDYSLITYGDLGNYAFNDEGRAAMTEFFLDDFSGDWWYDGFSDYLSWTAAYLDAAAAGEPYGAEIVPVDRGDVLGSIAIYLLAVLLLPLIIAFVGVRIMDAKMKSVAAATQASEYVIGGLQLSNQVDAFSHVTKVVVPIPKSDNNIGGGGPSTFRAGGFSGTGGKF